MTQSWRDIIKIHPAAEMFALMAESELRELGEDIKKNGLREQVALWSKSSNVRCNEFQLLDGRNRLDAMELVGIATVKKGQFLFVDRLLSPPEVPDPYAYVISANIHRRHLTHEQRRDIIAALLKAQPDKSDRQIAKEVKDDHKKVARVRAEQEANGALPHLSDPSPTQIRDELLARYSTANMLELLLAAVAACIAEHEERDLDERARADTLEELRCSNSGQALPLSDGEPTPGRARPTLLTDEDTR